MKLIFDRADSPDLFYLCGFHSDVKCLYTETEEERVLYVPGFEYLRAKQEARVNVEKLEDIDALLKSFTGPFVVGPLFPHSFALQLEEDVTIETELVPERKVKEDQELQAIQDAQQAAARAIAIIQEEVQNATLQDGILVREGEVVTSEYLKYLARSHLIQQGYDCPDIIVASGEQTAQPHNRGSGPIRQGPLIIDCFPQSQHTLYHGDMTRTIIVGKDDKAQKMLTAVQKAHDACVKACAPGVRANDLYALCMQVLFEEGYASDGITGMIHSLGHGIGLAVHERPALSPKDDTVLKEGMVVTIEPGLYYDVGVRFENIIVVGRGIIE